MAKDPFNVEPNQIQDPRYLGMSSGTDRAMSASPMQPSGIRELPTPRYQTDTSTGDMLTSVAKLGTAATAAVDDLFKETIKEDVFNKIDSTRKQFINDLGGAIQTAEASTGATTDVIPSGTVPPEVAAVGKRVSKLGEARTASKLTEADYWTRLEAYASEMRNRFPGHRDYVDAQVAKVAGTTPANALWRTRLSALTSMAAAGRSKAEDEDKYIERNAGHIPEAMIHARYGSDPSKRPSMQEIKKEVALSKSRKGEIEDQMQDLNFARADRTDKEDRATKVGTSIANDTVQQAVDEFYYGAGKDGMKVFKDIVDTGRIPDDKETADLLGMVNQLKLAATTRLETNLSRRTETTDPVTGKTVLGPTIKSLMDPGKLDTVRKESLSRITAIEDAISNKTFGTLVRADAVNKAMKDNTANKILSSSPTIRTGAVIKDQLGETAAQLGWNEMGMIPEILKVQRMNNEGEVLTKDVKDVGEAMRRAQSKGETRSEVFRGMFDDPINKINMPDVQRSNKLTYAKYLFSDGSREAVNGLDPNSRDVLYNKYTAPTFVQNMLNLKDEDSGATWNQYKTFIKSMFVSKNKIDMDTIAGGHSNLNITLDKGKIDFTVENPNLSSDNKQHTVISSINKINSGLKQLTPIVKEDGYPDMELKLLLDNSGLRLRSKEATPVKLSADEALGVATAGDIGSIGPSLDFQRLIREAPTGNVEDRRNEDITPIVNATVDRIKERLNTDKKLVGNDLTEHNNDMYMLKDLFKAKRISEERVREIEAMVEKYRHKAYDIYK